MIHVQEILPFNRRNECKNKRKTALCTCQEEWYIHETQVQVLLEKFLFKVATDYNIPYMDTYESPVLPAENVSEILVNIKSVELKNDIEKEAFSFLKSALELAAEKNMPVYLFF